MFFTYARFSFAPDQVVGLYSISPNLVSDSPNNPILIKSAVPKPAVDDRCLAEYLFKIASSNEAFDLELLENQGNGILYEKCSISMLSLKVSATDMWDFSILFDGVPAKNIYVKDELRLKSVPYLTGHDCKIAISNGDDIAVGGERLTSISIVKDQKNSWFSGIVKGYNCFLSEGSSLISDLEKLQENGQLRLGMSRNDAGIEWLLKLQNVSMIFKSRSIKDDIDVAEMCFTGREW